MIIASLPEIVVVGGGFSALEAIFDLRRRLRDSARYTLISDEQEFLFRPNLIYVPFGKDPEELKLPLDVPCKAKDITFVHGRAESVDTRNKVVQTTEGGSHRFDYLVLATGARMVPQDIEGLENHANTIFTADEMLRLRSSLNAVVEWAAAGEQPRVLFLVPPHNQCSGPLYEIAMMLDTWLRRRKNGIRERVHITFATMESSYIAAFGPRLHEVAAAEFDRRHITAHVDMIADRVEDGLVYFQGGDRIPYDLLISFPPYKASTRFEGLPTGIRGFIETDLGTRAVEGHPGIYAVGDAADFPVKQAFLALLQADAAAEQIAADILDEEPAGLFDPVSMCIMEQFDQATYANVPLELTGDPRHPVQVRDERGDEYKVGTGEMWRMGKKMLGIALPFRFRHGAPFHAGPMWTTMELGLDAMKGLFAK